MVYFLKKKESEFKIFVLIFFQRLHGAQYGRYLLSNIRESPHLDTCVCLYAVLSSLNSQPGLVNSNLLMQTKTFLSFYHHAEVKRKDAASPPPNSYRPDGAVEKFVYNEKIFKEEPGSGAAGTYQYGTGRYLPDFSKYAVGTGSLSFPCSCYISV